MKTPEYYKGKITPFDVIDDWGLDFYLGNVVKYIIRHDRKGTPKEDIDKALHYIEEAIERLPKTQTPKEIASFDVGIAVGFYNQVLLAVFKYLEMYCYKQRKAELIAMRDNLKEYRRCLK